VTGRRHSLADTGWVAAGGAIGALARVALATWLPSAAGSFPATTFLENVVGAFLLATLLTLLTERTGSDPAVRLWLCTGMLGAFTTYSTFATDLARLVVGGHVAVAAGYATATLAAGFTAGVLGIRVGRAWPRRRHGGSRPDRGRPAPGSEPGVAP
jgi:fluoride exporter